ncbi:MAG: hypothetical protein ACI9JT_001849 [Polaribacter sp.]|jgi:hypothetical protein
MDDNNEKNNRRKSITIRLDDPVFDELHDLKNLGKFKTWEMLILFFLNENKSFKKVYIDKNGHSLKVLTHLNKYASNLNQLARKAHETNKIELNEVNKMREFFTQGVKAKNYFSKKVISNYDSRSK